MPQHEEMQRNKERKVMKTFIKVVKTTFFYGGFLAVILGLFTTIYIVDNCGFDIPRIAGCLMMSVFGGHVMWFYKK